MTDDIVARLCVLNHHAKKLAENESLHDLYREAFTRCEDLTLEASAEIKRLRELSGDAGKLREERDEARQEICLLRASSTNATEKVSFEMIAYAASRGWDDLFADEGKHERDA